MKMITTQRNGKSQRFLLRGDSEGYVTLWTVPEITIEEVKQIQDRNSMKSKKRSSHIPISILILKKRLIIQFVDRLAGLVPTICTSLSDAWSLMRPQPVGILDQMNSVSEPSIKLTASIYLPQQSRLVVGRQDGTIIIVPATQTVMLQLLHVNPLNYNGGFWFYLFIFNKCYVSDSLNISFFNRLASPSNSIWSSWPNQLFIVSIVGASKVSEYKLNTIKQMIFIELRLFCVESRYDKSHLLSGGVDFAVCLWDLYSGALLHRFCVHAGEITQLLVPPNSCSVS